MELYILIIIGLGVLGVLGLLGIGFQYRATCKQATGTTPGVYCVRQNIYRYTAAQDLAKRFGGRLATSSELKEACQSGCHWAVLGWCEGLHAYTCKNGVLRGGKMPGQLKLGVYIYGFRPSTSSGH
jgi:hypothetical protein